MFDHNMAVAELLNPVPAAVPGAGSPLTGDWINMKDFGRIGVLVQGDAEAEELTVTLQQAKDASGTDAKALNIMEHWDGVATKVRTDARPDGVASLAIASGAQGCSVVEVMMDDLDVNNDFTHVMVSVAGSTARVVSATYLCAAARHRPASMVDPTV